MNIFLDTNVILENFVVRENYETAHQLFLTLRRQNHCLFMSVGGFYTIIFLIDKYLRKESGLTGDERIMALRQIMSAILQTIQVAEHNNDSLLRGINNVRFRDFEDSCQYELAGKAGCEILITFNVSDFPISVDASVQVLSPQQYLDLFGTK